MCKKPVPDPSGKNSNWLAVSQGRCRHPGCLMWTGLLFSRRILTPRPVAGSLSGKRLLQGWRKEQRASGITCTIGFVGRCRSGVGVDRAMSGGALRNSPGRGWAQGTARDICPFIPGTQRHASSNSRSRKTLTPFFGIAGGVEHSINSHRAFRILIEDCIRKAAYQSTTIAFVGCGVHFGSPADSLQASLDATQEVFSQARPLNFVPGVTFCNVLSGLWRENQFSDHENFESVSWLVPT